MVHFRPSSDNNNKPSEGSSRNSEEVRVADEDDVYEE